MPEHRNPCVVFGVRGGPLANANQSLKQERPNVRKGSTAVQMAISAIDSVMERRAEFPWV